MSDSVVFPDCPQELILYADELPVLTCHISLPSRPQRPEGRFNRYYRACAAAFESCCRRELLPRAESAYYRAVEEAGPIPQWQAQLRAAVTLQQGALCSLRSDTLVRGMAQPMAVCRGDTWDLRRELLLSVQDCFPSHAPWRQMLLHCARTQIAAWEAQGIARYHENWQQLLPRALHPHHFYLTEEGFCFFFPPDAIAPPVEGIPTFCLPYNEEAGPFLPHV